MELVIEKWWEMEEEGWEAELALRNSEARGGTDFEESRVGILKAHPRLWVRQLPRRTRGLGEGKNEVRREKRRRRRIRGRENRV